jgi:hypothetical protein
VLGLLVGTSIVYLVTPFSGGRRIEPWIGENFRYALPALGVLAILSALGMAGLRLPDGLLAAATILAGPGRALNRTFGPAVVLAVGLWSIHAAANRMTRSRAAVGIALAAAALLIILGTSELRRIHADRKTARYGPVYASDSGVVTAGETIGYVASHAKYLFYGPDLQRTVRYVPPATGSLHEWLADLDRLGVDVVAVGPIERRKWSHRAERAWLDDPSGPFVRTLGQDPTREIVLYRRRAAARAPRTDLHREWAAPTP